MKSKRQACRAAFALSTERHHLPATMAGIALAAVLSLASIFGSLANFDTVNDTGSVAYGFEIEIEDTSFYKVSVGSVFGLNRSFASVGNGDPLAVVRFHAATVTDYEDTPGHHAGVRITYGGMLGGISTPANDPLHPFSTPGESCWPGSPSYSVLNPCDHFGITTLGSPAKTTYYWLTAGPSPSGLVRQVVGVPAVQFAYTPAVPAPPIPNPPPPVPAVVNAQIHAVAIADPEHPEYVDPWGQAYWVKTYTTKVDKVIDIGNLLRGDAEAEKAEIETEWSLFQMPPAGRNGVNEMKERDIQIGDADKAIIRRYEFFKYVGPVNAEDGEAICEGLCDSDPVAALAVGAYVGQQIAGFNAPVPEPKTWAMLLAGMVGMAAFVRRRARR
jgi:hypothetical protein